MKLSLVPWLLLLPSLALGQRAGDDLRTPFPEFRELLAKSGLVIPDRFPNGSTPGSRQLHLQFDGQEVKILAQQRHAATVRRRRSPRLDGDVILVTAVDRNRQVRFWNVIPDPRVVHVEVPGPGGELHGRPGRLESASFLLAFPDDPYITEIRFDVPRHEGAQVRLEPLAKLNLTDDR